MFNLQCHGVVINPQVLRPEMMPVISVLPFAT
jgi:hypothetical protein